MNFSGKANWMHGLVGAVFEKSSADMSLDDEDTQPLAKEPVGPFSHLDTPPLKEEWKFPRMVQGQDGRRCYLCALPSKTALQRCKSPGERVEDLPCCLHCARTHLGLEY